MKDFTVESKKTFDLNEDRIFAVLIDCFYWRNCLPRETPTKNSIELAAISNFHNRRSNWWGWARDFLTPNSTPQTLKPVVHERNVFIKRVPKRNINLRWSELFFYKNYINLNFWLRLRPIEYSINETYSFFFYTFLTF